MSDLPLLQWSAELELGQSVMDETHREFVEAHFGQEDRWMEEMAFPPIGCHKGEHANVLEVVREVRTRVAGGESEYATRLVDALAEWFPHHAQTMDALLAEFIRDRGYEPERT